MFASKFLFALAAVATTVSAAALDVTAPPITSPKAGDHWIVGSVQTVTWEVPTASVGQNGIIFLGYVEDGSLNEHLDVGECHSHTLYHPLAQGFPIAAGAVNVTVPVVVPRDNYIIALLGDTGNISPKFTIAN
ncbi:hypothetical protein C8Q80DRAFT_1093582 [Daedaleopsis nitida]|nr:hypothetical protein C8Q80DRAFT_1093582 [Daedaleopsis nitida]